MGKAIFNRFPRMSNPISLPIYHVICGLKAITENVLFNDMMSCLTLIEIKIKTLNTLTADL